MNEAFLKNAHKHCSQNREELERSEKAGCLYCKEIYSAKEIAEWILDKGGDTAECPKCGIDSVIGDASQIIINSEFLEEMHKIWFEKTIPLDEIKKKLDTEAE